MKTSTLIELLRKEMEKNGDAEIRFEDRSGYREFVNSVRYSKAAEESLYNEEDQIVISR